MTIFNKIIKYIVSLSIIVSIILSTIDYCCFDKNFYYKKYEEYNTKDIIQTDDANLKMITDNLLDYLKNRNDDIDINYIRNGVSIPVYQDIEIIHMSDVKDLYLKVVVLKNILIIISLAGILYLLIEKISFKKEFNSSLLVIIFSLALIAISCFVDFDSFWISFHKLFFTKNDYWLLDPRTCILVNLFNSDFFFSLCIKICLISFIVIFAICILVNYYEKKKYN